MDSIISIINGVGFPIAACVGMALYIKEESKNHRAEVESLRETIDDLKDVLTEIKAILTNK